MTGVYDIVDYGAVSGADCTAAIQAALDAATDTANRRGASVYVPPGTWLTRGNTLLGASGVRVFGCGGRYSQSVLAYSGDPGGAVLTLQNSECCQVEGLQIQGDDTCDGIRIRWDGSSNYNSVENQIENVSVTHCANGVSTGDGGQASVSEAGYRRLECSSCGVGVRVSSGNSQNQRFDGCRFTSCDYGIKTDWAGVLVRDTLFALNRVSDVYLGDVLIGNRFDGCYTESSARFLTTGGPSGGVAPTTLTGCFIATTEPDCIVFQFCGPLNLTGNYFGTRGQSQCVRVGGQAPTPVNSTGNVWWNRDDPFESLQDRMVLHSVNDLIRYDDDSVKAYSRATLASDFPTLSLTLLRTNDDPTSSNATVVWASGKGNWGCKTLWSVGNDFGGQQNTWFVYDNVNPALPVFVDPDGHGRVQ